MMVHGLGGGGNPHDEAKGVDVRGKQETADDTLLVIEGPAIEFGEGMADLGIAQRFVHGGPPGLRDLAGA